MAELAVILGIILIIALIIYAIILFWTHRNQRFIFASYKPPILKDGFYPAGDQVIPLTPEEQLCRQHALGVTGIQPPTSCITNSGGSGTGSNNNV